MNLINKKVQHQSFGTGRIIRCNGSFIEIDFPIGNKKFVFPDAFKRHLRLDDKKSSKLIEEKLQAKERKRFDQKQRLLKEQEEILREKELKLEEERIAKIHKAHPSLQTVFWCKKDEIDNVLNHWRVFTGLIKSGAKKGQPNRLVRLNKRSACLITTREPEIAEKDRRIVGLYMVDPSGLAKSHEDGYIPAHSEYRLRLSEEESEKMLFWTYYLNKRYPDKITWNTGRYRYFDNVIMAQILRDIISLKEDLKERDFAQKFFQYFCKLNQINEKNLAQPNGALTSSTS